MTTCLLPVICNSTTRKTKEPVCTRMCAAAALIGETSGRPFALSVRARQQAQAGKREKSELLVRERERERQQLTGCRGACISCGSRSGEGQTEGERERDGTFRDTRRKRETSLFPSSDSLLSDSLQPVSVLLGVNINVSQFCSFTFLCCS